jgi:hypothetical protein
LETQNIQIANMNTKVITLEFTMQELQLVAAGLQELKYREVVNLLMRIDSQVQKQMQAEAQNDKTD